MLVYRAPATTPIEQAQQALHAAETRFNQMPADAPDDLFRTVLLEMLAAEARLTGLFWEVREKAGLGHRELIVQFKRKKK